MEIAEILDLVGTLFFYLMFPLVFIIAGIKLFTERTKGGKYVKRSGRFLKKEVSNSGKL